MKPYSLHSAMVDLTYFIESKQRFKTLLEAKGKDIAGVTAEIATMTPIGTERCDVQDAFGVLRK